MYVLDFAGDAVRGKNIAKRGIFPARDDDGQVLFARGHQPAVLGVDLVMFLETTGTNHLVHELVREEGLAVIVGIEPQVEHDVFDSTDGLFLGNAGVGHAVQVPRQQLLFVLRGQLPVVWDTHIVVVRDEVEDVFLEVGARAANRMHLIPANHLRQRETEFGRAHGAGQCHEHHPAVIDVLLIGVGSVDKRGRVKMPVVMMNKVANRSHRRYSILVVCYGDRCGCRSRWKQSI